MAAPGGQMPVGGAGAAAPAADPFPIHNDLTYADYFDFLIEDQIRRVHTYRPPMSDEFEAAEDEGGDTIDVHTKYLKHFFENDPAGAQRALRQFIEHLAEPETLRYYAAEEPVDGFTYNIMLLINEYLKYGARLTPLSDLIASIPNDPVADGENYDPDEDYGRSLRQKLQRRLLQIEKVALKSIDTFKKQGALPLLPENVRHAIPNALAKDAWKRRGHAMKAWGMRYEEGGGRRTRRSRRNRRSRNRRTRHRK